MIREPLTIIVQYFHKSHIWFKSNVCREVDNKWIWNNFYAEKLHSLWYIIINDLNVNTRSTNDTSDEIKEDIIVSLKYSIVTGIFMHGEMRENIIQLSTQTLETTHQQQCLKWCWQQDSLRILLEMLRHHRCLRHGHKTLV